MLNNNRCLAIAALLALTPFCAFAAQSTEPVVLRLAKINVVEAASYTRDQVITISGLKEGQPVRLADFGAAADRLTASGLFRSVTYRYAYTGADAEVTLEIVEDKVQGHVVFDNFIWFKDQELVDAVRQEAPWFDGTSPGSTGALESIKRALQGLLRQKNIDGQVEYTSQTDLYGRARLEIFSVKGADFPVCEVVFHGVGSAHLSEISDKSKPLLKGQYSRAFTSAFVSGSLIPVYRSKGYLQARFQNSEAAICDDSNCRGVTLKLKVDEGSPYTWLKAQWTGNQAIASGELDRILNLRAGEVANGLKMDSGLAAIREAYGKLGYIGSRIASQADYSDPEHRVAFQFNVDEGPQYHMGQLVLNGMSDKETTRIKGKWKLAEGDVFDASYFREFVNKELSGDVLGGPRNLQISSKPDRQTRKIDIVIAATSGRTRG